MINIKNLDGQYIALSDAYAKFLGYNKAEDIIGKYPADIFPLKNALAYQKQEKLVLNTARKLTFQNKFIHPDKGLLYIEGVKTPVLNEKKAIVAIETVITDVTEKYLLINKLQREQMKFKKFFNDIPVAVWIKDARNRFINAHIIPYFKDFTLKNITVSDVESFRQCMQKKQISERRIKNILTLLNQIIKYFQNEGYINKTCVFEVKRIANIPKRQILILTPEQLSQLFKITNKKYPYLTSIIQNLITLKQPLNTILTGSEQEKKSLKRKIRKDFYKIKRELDLTNYMFDDLRFCQKCAN